MKYKIKRILKTIGLIFCIFYLSICVIAAAAFCFEGNWNDCILAFVFSCVFALPLIIWRINNRKMRIQMQEKTRDKSNSGKVINAAALINEIQALPPNPCPHNIIRILQDSLKIIVTTKNPDTYFSRFDLLSDRFPQAPKRGISILERNVLRLTACAIEAEKELNRHFLQRYYEETLLKIQGLKTDKAKSKRVVDFSYTIDNYAERLDTEQSVHLLNQLKEQTTLCEVSVLTPAATVSSKHIQSGLSPDFDNLHIPEALLSVMWFENGPKKNIDKQINEPSAIDCTLPMAQPGTDIPTPGYYPSYRELTSEQRWIYLHWLENIEQPIDIGYVFVLYYGLERFLFTEKWETAASIICKLRIRHTNDSFQWYSACGLLIAASIGQHESILNDPSLLDDYPALYIRKNGYLHPETIIHNARRWGFTNTRYITGQYAHPDLFRTTLVQELQARYQMPFLPVTREELEASTNRQTLALANYSLPKRTATIEDITSSKPITEKAFRLLSVTHEKVKQQLAEERKKSKN